MTSLFEDFDVEELMPDEFFDSDIPALLLTRKCEKESNYGEDAQDA